MTTAPPSSPPRARTGALEIVGFVLAVLVPLAGLVVSIVAVVRAHRRALRASALTVAAVPIAAGLLVVQVAAVAAAVGIAQSVEHTADAAECTSLTRYSDLLAADGPASLADLTSDGWDARQPQIGTWHSQVLQLQFDLDDQTNASGDPYTAAVHSLEVLLDPQTGFAGPGKDWTIVAHDVSVMRAWRTAHCG